jgi:hypothetical protein
MNYPVFPTVFKPVVDRMPPIIAYVNRPHKAAQALRVHFAKQGTPVAIYAIEIPFIDNAYFLPDRFRPE